MQQQTRQQATQADAFLEGLERRRVSQHTVRAYRSDLTQLLKWLDEQSMTAAHLSRSVCREYASELAASGAAPATIARKLTSMRAFVAFLAEAGIVSSDAASGARAPARKRSLPLVPSQQEMQRVLEEAERAIVDSRFADRFPADFRGEIRAEIRSEICQKIRDLALLELLYGCGLRSAEVCELRLSDVRRDQGMLIVRGKGEKTRMVPYAPATLSAIDAWLAIRPDSRADNLLLTTRRNPLGTSDVRRIVRAAGQRAGVTIHPHSLRHACATHLMEEGADIRMIQEFLGHANITTTQIYTRVSETQLKNVYLRSHPRAPKEVTR
jgi:integrase/recombinase XerC